MKNSESDGIGPLSPAAHVGVKRKLQESISQSSGLAVRPIWLSVSHSERYLFLEDKDTGDVLLPLIYMKGMFEANYSRKLSSLKHRLVSIPENINIERPRGFVYWKWAFESPHEVKVLVRKMLGEENTPQGHLRLILLPIVFNAMAQKAKLRQSPFFRELYKAVKASSYWPLLKLPSLDDEFSVHSLLKDQDELKRSNPFFPVPFSPTSRDDLPPNQTSNPENYSLRTAHPSDSNPTKRTNSNSSSFGKSSDSILSISQPGLTLGSLGADLDKSDGSNGRGQWQPKKNDDDSLASEWGLGKDRPATLDLMNLNQSRWSKGMGGGERESGLSLEILSRDHVSESNAENTPLFHGPYDLQRTISKYCLSFEAAEENDNKKKNMSGMGQANSLEDNSAMKSELDFLKSQGEEIKVDVIKLRTECQEQISHVCSELRQIKQCLNGLITVLSPKMNTDPKSLVVGMEEKQNGDKSIISHPSSSQSYPLSHLHPHPPSHSHPSYFPSSSTHSDYHSMANYLNSHRTTLIPSSSSSSSYAHASMAPSSSFADLNDANKLKVGLNQMYHRNLGMNHSSSSSLLHENWAKANGFHSVNAQAGMGMDISQSQNQSQSQVQGQNKMNGQSLSQLLSFNSCQTNSNVPKAGNGEDNNLYSQHSNMTFHQLLPETPKESNLTSHWVFRNSHSAETTNSSQTNQTGLGIPLWGNKNS